MLVPNSVLSLVHCLEIDDGSLLGIELGAALGDGVGPDVGAELGKELGPALGAEDGENLATNWEPHSATTSVPMLVLN